MWRRKRMIVGVVLAVVLLVGTIGGVALAADEEDVVEHDGTPFMTGVEDQTTGSQENVFEDVIDLLLNTQVWSGKPLQIAENSMMVKGTSEM